MVTTRRNGGPPSSPHKPISSTSNPAPSTPSLPTPPLWLLLYPSTLLLGSLFSLLNPSASSAPYSTTSQSHPAQFAPSYFATKANVFNVYFVKIGWFWITLSFLAFQLTRGYLPSAPTRSIAGADVTSAEDEALAKRLQALLRWAGVTVWWIAVTQWFFGPPVIDRGFRWTGGKCEKVLQENPEDVGDLVSAAACRLAGGQWAGGHDISGHVFLLVLGSAFLGMEALPHVRTRLDRGEDLGWQVWFVGGVGALSWWMVLMTAAYFHTWFEKLTGLLVAYTALASIYYLPALVPSIRAVVGEPAP